MKNSILRSLLFSVAVLFGTFLSAYLPKVSIKVNIESRDRLIAQAQNVNDLDEQSSECMVTLNYESDYLTGAITENYYLP